MKAAGNCQEKWLNAEKTNYSNYELQWQKKESLSVQKIVAIPQQMMYNVTVIVCPGVNLGTIKHCREKQGAFSDGKEKQKL